MFYNQLSKNNTHEKHKNYRSKKAKKNNTQKNNMNINKKY